MDIQEDSLRQRISQVLEEIRVVMPGSQALLGFQLVALFSTGFDDLPAGLQELHLASLGLIAAATIFLMAPSAFHRIACGGESRPMVHRFASRMLITAMLFLVAGLATDVWVATYVVLESPAISWAASVTLFAGASLLWFIYPAAVSRRAP